MGSLTCILIKNHQPSNPSAILPRYPNYIHIIYHKWKMLCRMLLWRDSNTFAPAIKQDTEIKIHCTEWAFLFDCHNWFSFISIFMWSGCFQYLHPDDFYLGLALRKHLLGSCYHFSILWNKIESGVGYCVTGRYLSTSEPSHDQIDHKCTHNHPRFCQHIQNTLNHEIQPFDS